MMAISQGQNPVCVVVCLFLCISLSHHKQENPHMLCHLIKLLITSVILCLISLCAVSTKKLNRNGLLTYSNLMCYFSGCHKGKHLFTILKIKWAQLVVSKVFIEKGIYSEYLLCSSPTCLHSTYAHTSLQKLITFIVKNGEGEGGGK